LIKVETARLEIRNFCASDAPGLRETILAYQASAYAAYDHPWPNSAEEINGVVDWFANGDSFLAVCLKATGQFIGFFALNRGEDPGAQVYDLGYVFNSAYHRQGYASEGCRALLDYAFEQLGAQRITSGTAAVNLPSCKLLARLGFQIVGGGRRSFQQDGERNPIEFEGYQFELARSTWKQ
jgi:ribosomal-protein-alanine N-acetyltransferase